MAAALRYMVGGGWILSTPVLTVSQPNSSTTPCQLLDVVVAPNLVTYRTDNNQLVVENDVSCKEHQLY